MTVGELEDRMSARELAEWAMLARIDPWGVHRSDLQLALAAWSPIAAAGGRAKVEDFLPPDRSEDFRAIKEQDAHQVAAASGAKVMSKKELFGG
ncbi:MAG: hypothetical protein EBR82_16970 [Caulobacteraceae bacterium]|nr:hypothetical protein [Caulobacteraceae bacterium]